MSAAPPLSVVLPVRDGGAFFPEALDSLAAQTFGDYELLIQDDGSTDGSLELARERARDDRRIHVESGPALGVVHAANRATERARAALILRMDADDVARPDRFARQVEFATAHPDVGMFGSRIAYFPRDALGDGMRHYEAWLNGVLTHDAIWRERFVEYPLPHPTTVVRAEVFRRVGGFRDGDFPEDYDFFLRAAAAGVRFGKHPDVLLDWRHGAHRTTGSDPRYGLDRFRALKVHHLRAVLGDRPVALVGAGRAGKAWADALGASGIEPAMFVDEHQDRIGPDVRGVRVIRYDDVRPGPIHLVTLGSGSRDEAVARLDRAGAESIFVQ